MDRILHSLDRKSDDCPDFMFWCPACKCGHAVWTTQSNKWTFEGTLDCPTFKPSLLIERMEWNPPVTPENLEEWRKNPWPQVQVKKICHLNVTAGELVFHGDSTHEFAGKIVPMEAF